MSVPSNSAEFEAALAKLCRFYRAQHELFVVAVEGDKDAIVRWVRTGGSIMENMDEVQSDIEVYSGLTDLRPTLERLKQMRDQAEQDAPRT